jgi:urease accessory protein
MNDASLVMLNPPLPFTNNTHSSACLEVSRVAGKSTVTRAYASSPLKLLTPRSRAASVWAYTSSFGGGLVAGDQTRLSVRVGEGARCFLSTQATTKVYRNLGGLPCWHCTYGMVDDDAVLVFAPDRVQPFAGSNYWQKQEWHLAESAGLVLLDWFCSGRMARGERWRFGRLQSRNDVFVAGQRVFVDSILLEGAEGALEVPDGLGACQCIALLLLLGPPLRPFAASVLETVSGRPISSKDSLTCSASPVREGVVVRIASADTEAVAQLIEEYLRPLSALLGDNPWDRKW